MVQKQHGNDREDGVSREISCSLYTDPNDGVRNKREEVVRAAGKKKSILQRTLHGSAYRKEGDGDENDSQN